MKKKRTIPKGSPPPFRVERFTVGDGITQREKWRIPGPSTPEEIATYQALAFRPGENEFEKRIFPIEAIAKKILERAGLPTDLSGLYSIPRGEKVPLFAPGVGNLAALVEGRGFREREHLEWYAAEILINIRIVRNFIAEADAATAAGFAVAVGELTREARDKSLFEPDALLGKGDRQTRRRGGLTTGQRTRDAAEERNADVLRRGAELLPKHPNLNGRAAIIARELGRKYWTVRDILKRSKQIPSPSG